MSRIQKAIARASKLRATADSIESPVSGAIEHQDQSRREIDPMPNSRMRREEPSFPNFEKRVVENPLLVSLEDEKSVPKEQFQKLKSEILVKTKNGQTGNTFLITSSVPGEGKTLTACNLAISLAQEFDHTVLLVDADLRRPRVHELFELDVKDGLIQCLKGETNIEDAIYHAGIGKLSVLPAGGVADDPVALLSSSRMTDIINEIKNRYPERFIIIDSTPALLFADARSLGEVVDGVLYVARERIVKASQVRQGLQTLKGAPLMGVIYNGTDETNVTSSYNSYY